MATRELEVSVNAGVLELHGDVNAGAEYISSTGIAVIVGLLAQARTQGVEVKAIGLSDHYREIFEITRLADFMTIEGSNDA